MAIEIDDYVIDVMMRDLVGHDKRPSAFLVYLYLAVRSEREMKHGVACSLRRLAEATGLSKSAAQQGAAHLAGRNLITVIRETATSVPVYHLNRHWRPRSKKSAS
jgi:hypothetical protein